MLTQDDLDGIARMTEQELDSLPFGAIRLDGEGRVVSYNAAEARAAGRDRERVVGRNFFIDVAPCVNVQEFAGRYREGVARKQLHATFPFRFVFDDRVREVVITLFYSAGTDSGWVFVRDTAPDL